jgi:catechol 2,3-dioxygenase-like lactoylglutathione lyase family enzyme
MLENGAVATRLPAQDLERARAFYAEKLGLEPAEERPGGLLYRCARGEFASHAEQSWGTVMSGNRVRRWQGKGCGSSGFSVSVALRSRTTSPGGDTAPNRTVAGHTPAPSSYRSFPTGPVLSCVELAAQRRRTMSRC